MYITFEEIKDSGEKTKVHFNEKLDAHLTNDRASVEWIDGYIQRNREVLSPERYVGWSIAFGYLVGEAMIKEYGGAWEYDETIDEWMVDLGESLGFANPIGKAYKCLAQPPDSVLSFFDVIGLAKAKGGFSKLNNP